jgi:hypothetical protein
MSAVHGCLPKTQSAIERTFRVEAMAEQDVRGGVSGVSCLSLLRVPLQLMPHRCCPAAATTWRGNSPPAGMQNSDVILAVTRLYA